MKLQSSHPSFNRGWRANMTFWMTSLIFIYETSEDYLQKHTNEIPMKFDLQAYGFNNMAAKFIFHNGKQSACIWRQGMAKCTHKLIIITPLSSSPKLKWNLMKTEGPFNPLHNAHKTRNTHNRKKKHPTQQSVKSECRKIAGLQTTMRMLLQTWSWAVFIKPFWPAFLPQKYSFSFITKLLQLHSPRAWN